MIDLRRRSLVRRLVLIAGVWTLLVMLVAGVFLTAQFRGAAIRRFDQSLAVLTDDLYAGSSVDDGELRAPFLTDIRATRAYSGRYWVILDKQRDGAMRAVERSRSLFDSDLMLSSRQVDQLDAKPGKTQYFDLRGPQDKPLRAAAIQARLPGYPDPVVFLAAEDRSPIDADADRFAGVTAIALLILGVGLILAVVVQVRFGLQPLFRLRREVAAVRRGKTERVDGAYPDELEPLARELNALLAHNQEVVERQRTHVGNLAHALKTPLSVMLTEASQQPGQLAEVVERQAQTMREQVDHHLRRARAAARSQTSGERTPLEPILDELAVTLERIFQDKGVQIDWRCPEDLCFQGEKQDLMELAGNVMENAGKWCRGKIRVEAAPEGEARLLLTVDDDGPGLPPEERAQALKRGQRLDENAPGSGLGLSIVDELARAYGGSVQLGESPLGGLRVCLDLPRAEA
ncbi:MULTISPECIES: ATP-binding protein [Caulobacter]|uniref:histidine kinase n=2 Tax=Pseudomonadota TaxID=1224 RepID=R0EK10_CAUVI|nr:MULTISPECIES: ATP-binding protein [Caulobacter]ENZ81482.1 signal transduction histidine kinase [Caulobacter vibrioides OR37]MBQ1562152.1 HAMP domain-containing protein [Caulobacter sp.]